MLVKLGKMAEKKWSNPFAAHYFMALATLASIIFVMLTTYQHHEVIIDAGSSHSELFIYSRGPFGVRLRQRCMMKGGLETFADRLQEMPEYFHHCLEFAAKMLPKPSKTPLSLLATAGMRLLRMQNASLAAQVMQAAEDVLRETPFVVGSVRIATGREEAGGGWRAVSYMMNDVNVSSMDMGGASLQVATPVGNRLFAKSFLCYGIYEARRRHQQFLKSVQDPCTPRGVVFQAETASPCAPSLDKGALIGQGRPKKCVKALRKFFGTTNCSFFCLHPENVPPIHASLVGFSSIFENLRTEFNLSTTVSTTTVKKMAYRACTQPMTEDYPELPGTSGRRGCFEMAYLYVLMDYGLNVDEIKLEHKIGGETVPWTFGLLLVQHVDNLTSFR